MAKRLKEDLLTAVLAALKNKKLTGAQVFSELRISNPDLSKRLVYHYLYVALKKGLVTCESVVELGNYSWGNTTEKKYYRLARPP